MPPPMFLEVHGDEVIGVDLRLLAREQLLSGVLRHRWDHRLGDLLPVGVGERRGRGERDLLLSELGVHVVVGEAVAHHQQGAGNRQHDDHDHSTDTGQHVENLASHLVSPCS